MKNNLVSKVFRIIFFLLSQNKNKQLYLIEEGERMLHKLLIAIFTGTLFFSMMSFTIFSKDVKDSKIELPSSVLTIEKENTKGTRTDSKAILAPSEMTKQLLKTSNVPIENEEFIKQLNETIIESSPISIGNKAVVFLGVWPLSYESKETTANWNYQKVNTNYYDNRYGDQVYILHYVQESEKTIKGGLSTKVENPEVVKNLLLKAAKEKSKLPLAYETTIGTGTKKDAQYNVPLNHLGYLYAHAPAVLESGEVTYGEVYLMIKGTKKKLLVKNITTQEVSAWIPIENHLSFSYYTSLKPR